MGPVGSTSRKLEVPWRGKRMIKAFKYLVYFSDIFPKKYWKQFMEPSSHAMSILLSPNRTYNLRNSSFFTNRSQFSSDCFSKYSKPESFKIMQKSSDEIEDRPQIFPSGEDFFWSKEYLQAMDQNFDELFKDIYKDQFIDKIFGLRDQNISRLDFIEAITTHINGSPRAEWIFKSECIRTRLHENIDLIKVKEEIYTFNIDHEQSFKQEKLSIPTNLIIEEYEDV